jgi:Leucine-rich repeat (LRR) protein
LYCHSTQLKSLPNLPDGLRLLHCSHTPLLSLPNLPVGLQELYCHFTPLISLPELPSGLQVLECGNTPLLLQRIERESINDYNLRWDEWRSKKRSIERTKVLAEDIIAASWHPDRFERWCLDEEEKKENEELMG